MCKVICISEGYPLRPSRTRHTHKNIYLKVLENRLKHTMPVGREMPSASTQAYSNKTMNGNWWEDRIQESKDVGYQERLQSRRVRPYAADYDALVGYNTMTGQFPLGRTPRLARHKLPNTDRTIPEDFEQAKGVPDVYVTTKMEAESHLHERHASVRHPCLLTTKNLSRTIHANRPTCRRHPKSGYGGTLPRHCADEFAVHFETTNRRFYDAAPMEAREKEPDLYAPNDRTHYVQGQLVKDVLDKEPTGREVPRGRCGYRGELVRHPQESGNVYGDSTWVDEYSQWAATMHGTTREGMLQTAGH